MEGRRSERKAEKEKEQKRERVWAYNHIITQLVDLQSVHSFLSCVRFLSVYCFASQTLCKAEKVIAIHLKYFYSLCTSQHIAASIA